MYKITVSKESEIAIAQTVCDRIRLHDPNFNGAEFEIDDDPDLGLSIEGGDEIYGCVLHSAILNAIREGGAQ